MITINGRIFNPSPDFIPMDNSNVAPHKKPILVKRVPVKTMRENPVTGKMIWSFDGKPAILNNPKGYWPDKFPK